MEMYFNRAYDDLDDNGKRLSDVVARRISELYPNAVWHRQTCDLWKIVA